MVVAVPNDVRVGRVSIPIERAKRWVARYTDTKNTSSVNPYAYPAYDTYERDRNDPRRLTDADLLAPGLLNVPIKIRSFYDLQRIRPELEAGLSNNDLDCCLVEIEDPLRVQAMVKPLYTVLDARERKPWSVNATTLSKVLHRKRPQSLVLHDKWVRACYVGGDGPVKPSKNRAWADYMVEITMAIGHDIRSQQAAFKSLDEATCVPGDLTHVRILDILAWTSKGSAASEVVPELSNAPTVDLLLDQSAAVAPSAFLSAGSAASNSPGLYSWWVDDDGAADISQGLSLPFQPGLIYAGLAGATRWPSGTESRSTLWLRIATMHLAGSHEFSTFRRTLGAILASAAGATRVNEEALSAWMRDHLRVIAVPSEDRDALGRLETRVLHKLDPPLNLQGMTPTPIRMRLRELRGVVTRSD